MGSIDVLWFGFQPGRILDMVHAYGPAGRALYAQLEYTADGAFPLVYIFLFRIIFSLQFRNKPYAPFSTISVLPLAMMGFDFLENLCIVILLTSEDPSWTLAALCSVASNLKRAAGTAMLAVFVYGLVRWVLSKLRPRTPS